MIFLGILTPSKTEMYNNAFLLHSPGGSSSCSFQFFLEAWALQMLPVADPSCAYHQLSTERTACTSDGDGRVRAAFRI